MKKYLIILLSSVIVKSFALELALQNLTKSLQGVESKLKASGPSSKTASGPRPPTAKELAQNKMRKHQEQEPRFVITHASKTVGLEKHASGHYLLVVWGPQVAEKTIVDDFFNKSGEYTYPAKISENKRRFLLVDASVDLNLQFAPAVRLYNELLAKLPHDNDTKQEALLSAIRKKAKEQLASEQSKDAFRSFQEEQEKKEKAKRENDPDFALSNSVIEMNKQLDILLALADKGFDNEYTNEQLSRFSNLFESSKFIGENARRDDFIKRNKVIKERIQEFLKKFALLRSKIREHIRGKQDLYTPFILGQFFTTTAKELAAKVALDFEPQLDKEYWKKAAYELMTKYEIDSANWQGPEHEAKFQVFGALRLLSTILWDDWKFKIPFDRQELQDRIVAFYDGLSSGMMSPDEIKQAEESLQSYWDKLKGVSGEEKK